MSRSSALTDNYNPSTSEMNKNTDSAPSVVDENERLVHMQRMEVLLLGGLYWPREEVRQALAPRQGRTLRILDVGSVSGMWAAEMAKEFPHAEVLGIDKAPVLLSDIPPNCRFETLDIANADISHLEGGFDLVHCPRPGRWVRDYKPFITKIVKTVKPGGLYLHSEGDMQLYDENKQIVKPAQEGDEPGKSSWCARVWMEHKQRVSLAVDMPAEGFGAKLRSLLEEEHSLEDFMTRDVFAPVGWPGNVDDDLTNGEEIGEVVKSTVLERTRTFRPALVGEGIPAEEVDRWIREAEADVLEQRLKSYAVLHYVAARAKQID